jgi:hypothetical protein
MLTKSKGVTFVGLWLAITMVLSLISAGGVSAQTGPHYITVIQGANGKITPTTDTGQVPVADGGSKKFTITPILHYHVVDVTVDGGSVYSSLKWDGKIAYYTFTNVTADHEITATFSIDTPKLTILKTGPGAANGIVTSNPAGIDCGADCDQTYDWNTPVQLTASAVPDSGAVFKGWLVAGVLVNKNPLPVKITANKKIAAKFAQTYTLNIAKPGVGAGTVKSYLIAGINCGSDCDNVYPANKKVTLVATPDSASKFTAWSGDVSGTSKQITVTMDRNKAVNATFDEKAQPIQLAKKVSVVETSSGPGIKSLRIGRLGAVPGDSDFFTDQTTVYVQERSAETFELVNEILCKIGQTKYDEMLNKGNYKAQIDNNLCKSGKDDPSSAGQNSQNQSSSSTMPDYEIWTVNSSRADDSSPQIVKAWIHQKGMPPEPDLIIFAKAVIEKGLDEVPPYGLFTVSFKAYPDINVPLEYRPILTKGFMKTVLDEGTGKILLKFAEKTDFTIPGGGPVLYEERATLDRAADGSTGGGTAYIYEDDPWMPEPEESTFNFAYDPGYFLREEILDPPVQMCLSRTEFDETAWSYGLYDSSTGSRINRQSGFPIKAKVNTKDYYGWVGYWGVWFPKDITLTNGQTVYKFTPGPGGGDPVPYTLLKSGGRLKKYTRNEMTLGQIKNIPLDYRDMNDYKSYRLKWDGTQFLKFEWLDEVSNYVWVKIDPPVVYSLDNLQYDILTFWSQALNGNVQIRLNYDNNCTIVQPGPPPMFSCTATDDTLVNFYTQDLVYPGDPVPEPLYCFGGCPDITKLNSDNPFNSYDYPQIGILPTEPTVEHMEYIFDSNQMVLKQDGTPVVTSNPAPNYQWGLMSGSLFSAEYLDLLACELTDMIPANPDSTCGYKAWSELPVYYMWETGPNDWNQFTVLVDQGTGEPLKFEPPLLVSYLHQWDPLDPLNTSMFYLEYSGFGNLWGIPGHCVNPDTGLEESCNQYTRWIPQFTIAEGSLVTDVVDYVTQYLIKPLETEQRMSSVDPSNCGGLTPTPYDLPNMSEYTDPNIGNEPVVEGPPAVIGGVVQ